MKYIPFFEIPLLISLVLIRAAILRKQGIKVIVFGETNKTDFLLIPILLFFFYAICAAIFYLPFPIALKNLF
jgi:hypothetical protein